MLIQTILGIVLLGIVIVTMLKIVKNIVQGLVLILLVIIATSLILGGIPSLSEVPVVGSYLTPNTSGGVISAIKGIAWGIEILAAEKDAEGNLLIAVRNSGQFELTDFRVYTNNETLAITNSPKIPLKKDETTFIITDYQPSGIVKIRVEANLAADELLKEF